MKGSGVRVSPSALANLAAIDVGTRSYVTTRRAPVTKGGATRPAISGCLDQLSSELEDGVPLGDRGRIYGRADVLLDPLGGAS
jgi:hypothetical protein